MSVDLSRRGLFRAVTASVRAKGAEAAQPERMVARIGADCVETKGVVCRRCGEACDVSAIRFSPVPGGRAQALLDTDRCTGCGECLAVCPTAAITLITLDRAALVAGLADMGRNK